MCYVQDVDICISNIYKYFLSVFLSSLGMRTCHDLLANVSENIKRYKYRTYCFA